ncbi:MAG: hypothetical protein A2508_06535 [Candidatus Lambdaproteobacteria bacterium RIFOXYD12_FULL_49_8]|nr:MAG: hypothetical protein A2508_06535 [Candidatus Lambdaproteobacteria bacterium RIFOXYD12_FULL_49_8]
MLKILLPFFRLLILAVFLFGASYLSFFTPKNLLEGVGFTDDLKLMLVLMGLAAGGLFFTKERKKVEFYTPGEEEKNLLEKSNPHNETPSESGSKS